MRYKTDKNSTQSAYMQLYSQLKKDIVSGAYPLGAKLPSKRLLSEEAGVSVITVEHAYQLLSDEGYTEPRQRSGYFVIYKQSDFNSSDNEPRSIAPVTPNLHEAVNRPSGTLKPAVRKKGIQRDMQPTIAEHFYEANYVHHRQRCFF